MVDILNNKGFAVSSVLYTLLIAFLLFLGAALAQLSSSSSLIGKANDDIVNGTQFEAMQVKPNGACENGKAWYQDDNGNTSNKIVRIKSRYGTKYWPKDFETSDHKQVELSNDGNILGGTYTSYDGKIKTTVTSKENVIDAHTKSIFYLKINDDVTGKEATYPIYNEVVGSGMGIFDICIN